MAPGHRKTTGLGTGMLSVCPIIALTPKLTTLATAIHTSALRLSVSDPSRFDYIADRVYNDIASRHVTPSVRNSAEARPMACSPLQIVIFDLDDTLYPRSSGMMQAVGRLILRYMTDHLGMEPQTAVLLREAYLRDYGTTMAGLLRHNSLDPDDYLAYVHDVAVHEFLAPNPELDLVLGSISVEKAIWTNGSRAHAYRVLDALGIRDHFRKIIDVVDTGYVSKPAPHIYPNVLDMLGFTGPECVLVEDSARNLRPAKALGISTILVGDSGEDAVDVKITRIEQIGEALCQLRHCTSGDHLECRVVRP